MKRLLLLLSLLGLLAVRSSAEKIDLGAGKTLHLTLPETWISADLPARSPGMPEAGQNARYVTRSGSNDAVLITVMEVPDDRFSDPENLKAMMQVATQQFASGSVEGQVNIKELKFAGVTGLSATFTDANLVGKPSAKDDYKAMTSCFAYLGGRILVTATIFTDDVEGKAYGEAVHILKSISLPLPKDTM